MNEDEVKRIIGLDNWKDFLVFMRGKTYSLNNDGEAEYYDIDVERFLKLNTTVKRGKKEDGA